MAEDKSFRELIKEVQELNKSITQQKEELVDAQNRTTEMVTRRLTKAQTEQLDKDNEQIRVAKEEADRQAEADKKAQELEDKKFTMQKFNDRVANKLKKAPSALLGAARTATYNNKIMRGIGATLGKINRSFGIGSKIKAGGKTLFSIIRRLIDGGLIIGGIILLDKFFNSEMWPKTIDFIEKKLIPGIKDFFKFMRDKFGPLVTRLLFGKGGTFAQPTGGLYGAIKSVSSWIATTSKDIADFMKKDDTGSKFKNMIKSFVSLVGSIFGMGREKETDISKATYGTYNKSYFDNIKDAAKKFKDDFVKFFASLGRAFASGIFGYETDEEKFMDGVRNDAKLMIKKLIRGIGEAFAEAYPVIAKTIGLNTAAANTLLDMEKESPLPMKFIDASKEGGSAAVEKLFKTLTDEEKKFMTEYMNSLSKFESENVFKNKFNNALVKGIFLAKGIKAEDLDSVMGVSQQLSAGKADRSAKIKEGFKFMGELFSRDPRPIEEKKVEAEITEKRLPLLLKNLKNAEAKLDRFEKGSRDFLIQQAIVDGMKEALKEYEARNGAMIIDGSSKTIVENKDLRSTQPLAGNANGFLYNISRGISIYQ